MSDEKHNLQYGTSFASNGHQTSVFAYHLVVLSSCELTFNPDKKSGLSSFLSSQKTPADTVVRVSVSVREYESLIFSQVLIDCMVRMLDSVARCIL